MRYIFGALVLVVLSAVAQAGFVADSVQVDLVQDGPGHRPDWAGPPAFVFELLPDAAGNGRLDIEEHYLGPDPFPIVVSGQTDADPIMSIIKDVENDSDFTWTGYSITVPDGGDITFVGTPTSDRMTLVSQSAYALEFGAPDAVADGEWVQFSFDVLIPSTGPFTFTLTQEPIPEPATLGLLGLGGAVLILRRRRLRHA